MYKFIKQVLLFQDVLLPALAHSVSSLTLTRYITKVKTGNWTEGLCNAVVMKLDSWRNVSMDNLDGLQLTVNDRLHG